MKKNVFNINIKNNKSDARKPLKYVGNRKQSTKGTTSINVGILILVIKAKYKVQIGNKK